MPYLLAGPFVALIGILAIFFVLRRKSVEKRSMYSARRSQIEHKVRAARQRTLAPRGRSQQPAEPVPPAPTVAPAAAATSATSAGGWSVVSTEKESAATAAPDEKKKKKKGKAEEPATGSWSLASGDMLGAEAEEAEVRRPSAIM